MRHAASIAATFLALAAAAGAAAQALPPEQAGPSIVPAGTHAADRVMVQFAPGVRLGKDGLPAIADKRLEREARAALAAAGALRAASIFVTPPKNAALAASIGLDRWHRVELGAGRDPVAALVRLSKCRAFARVELDGAGGLAALPNDPSLPLQYSLRNTGQTVGGQVGIAGADVKAEGAWSYTTGDANLVIAVLDSGIDPHPELAGRILAGINVPDGNTVTIDECNHGTHVAGILAATGNNGAGIAGMTWNAKLLPVVVVNGCSGFEADVASGLTWATDQGAKLVNMSLQFYLGGTPLQQAVQYAHAQGVLMVAATGNNGNTNIAAPARYNQTIAVAATDNRDVRASFSNYGAEVDVCAPGVNVYSLSGATSYAYKSGTSFAAPHIAGAAALLWSLDPTLTRDEVRAAIVSTAVDLGTPGTDQFYGAGRLDAAAALASVVPPYAPEDLNQDGLVNAQDLAIVLAAWGACADCDGGCPADLNGDCLVDAQDLARILAAW
ncbi:MAG: S8 family serine peptidase [Planctomycetota bacterium]